MKLNKTIRRLSILMLLFMISLVGIVFLENNKALAEYTFVITAAPQEGMPDVGEVRINNKIALRIHSVKSSFKAVDRAQIIASRLQQAVNNGLTPDKISVRNIDKQVVIMANDKPIMVVTPEEAKIYAVTPSELAKAWLKNLQQALTLPTINLTSETLVIPINGNRFSVAGGTAKGDITVSGYDPEMIDVAVDQEVAMIQVWGKNLGKTVITLEREGIVKELSVEVRKLAGTIIGNVQVSVTGEPAPYELLKREALKYYNKGIITEPGAQFTVTGQIQGSQQSLGRGKEVVLYVPVKLSGPQYIDVKGLVPVRVINEALPFKEAGKLWVSNSPERLKRTGLLFQGSLVTDEATRFLFHHYNEKGQPKRSLLFEVTNPGTEPARLHFIQGLGGPSTDEIFVGQAANNSFVNNYYKNIGWFLDVMPGEKATIMEQSLSTGQVLSGLWQLHLLKGEKVDINLLVADANGTNMTEIPATDDPVLTRSKGIVENPALYLNSRYTIGERWSFVEIGGSKQQAYTTTGKPLYGNFGILHNVMVQVDNPLDTRRKVEVILVPGGGVARATVLVDGEILTLPLMKPGKEYQLKVFEIEPGDKRIVNVQIFPQSGSYYPVSIVTRSRG